MVGVEYRCITWSIKNRPHIYIFGEKFLWIRDSFSYYDFGIFSMFYMRIMQSENFATNIHTHYRQSETAPYIRALYARKISPQIYIYENCGAFRICASDWLGVDILAFVCVTFCICGHRLDKVVFVDWLMPNFGYKSVIGLYKFIVKMWLCICNCMCICVCIWYWLWFCCRLNLGSHQVVVELMKSDWCSLEVELMNSCSCICICLL